MPASGDTDGIGRAVLWSGGATAQDLGDLGGGHSIARGLNDLGQVVGRSTDAGEANVAFLWDEAGGMRDLGIAALASEAVAINNAGQVVGTYYPSPGETHAFLWDEANGLVELGDFIPTAVNNAGQVCGRMAAGNGHFHAVIWDPDTGIQDLGTFGGSTSQANGINDAGEVVGRYFTAEDDFNAFVWSPVSGLTDLGPVSFEGHAINNFGVVVGGAPEPSTIGLLGLGALLGLRLRRREACRPVSQHHGA